MKLYTKCKKCLEELEVKKEDNNYIVKGLYLNDMVLCNDCSKKEQEEKLKKICKSYDLDFNNCTTYIQDNTLFLRIPLGKIDREYYGCNDYDFIVNTKTSVPYIDFEGKIFELKDLDNKTIKRMMELVEFMCD